MADKNNLAAMTVANLRKLAKEKNISLSGITKKADIIQKLVSSSSKSTKKSAKMFQVIKIKFSGYKFDHLGFFKSKTAAVSKAMSSMKEIDPGMNSKVALKTMRAGESFIVSSGDNKLLHSHLFKVLETPLPKFE
jgi:hypothetical protein